MFLWVEWHTKQLEKVRMMRMKGRLLQFYPPRYFHLNLSRLVSILTLFKMFSENLYYHLLLHEMYFLWSKFVKGKGIIDLIYFLFKKGACALPNSYQYLNSPYIHMSRSQDRWISNLASLIEATCVFMQ